jgi:hypothetical protein
MSSSQLLTITESHGFRALVAVAMWIIGRIVSFWHGLRSLWSNSQPARMDVGRGSWSRILIGEVDCSPRLAVLWFDTMGRRDGPGDPRARRWRTLQYRSRLHFMAFAPVEHISRDQAFWLPI